MQQKQTEKSAKTQAIKPELRRKLITLGAKLVGTILLLYILLFRIYGFVRIDTNVMSPNVRGGDLALMFHLMGDYSIGDVVTYHCGDRICVGRVAAKEGDVVNIKDSKVLVNGRPEENTAYGDDIYPDGSSVKYPYTVAKEQYFILGDNRNEYDDSRSFGAINKSEITSLIIGVFRTHEL